MKYGDVPGVGKKISRIAQGCMMLGEGDHQAKTNALLDAVFEQGVNTFDHSHIYGGGACERAFGVWMNERGLRDEVVIVDKGCHHNSDRKRVTPFDIETGIHDSLARLKTDFIDIWLFHRDNPAAPIGPLVETLNQYHSKGTIKAFGGSNWTPERIEAFNEYAQKHGMAPMRVSSPNFSLAEQMDSPWGDDCITISGPRNKNTRYWYEKNGMAVFTWSSLARGFFSGRISQKTFDDVKGNFEEHMIRCYVCEDNWQRLDRLEKLAAEKGATVPLLALAYVLNQPFDVFALVGAATPHEARENVKALDIDLTPVEMAWLDLERKAR